MVPFSIGNMRTWALASRGVRSWTPWDDFGLMAGLGQGLAEHQGQFPNDLFTDRARVIMVEPCCHYEPVPRDD